MPYAYEALYRKTRLLVDAYVRSRQSGQALSVDELTRDPSVARAMEMLQRELANLPAAEQVALYGRMVRDAAQVAMAEARSMESARLLAALRLVDGYCGNLLDAAHRAIDAQRQEPSGGE